MATRSVVALLHVKEDGIEAYLQRRGYETRVVEAWDADAAFAGGDIDAAVVGLPAAAGIEVLRRHGDAAFPIVVLCRKDELVEKVLALELGAADVVETPTNGRELAARIAGILGRAGKGPGHPVVLENATVDLRSALVMHHSGAEEQLSPGQVALLRLFLDNPGKVLTREAIMAAAPAENAEAFDRSIDSRIARLRRRLDTEAIATIRGAGYRFDPPANRRD